MKQESSIAPAAAPAAVGPGRLALVGAPVVFLAYAVVLAVARDLTVAQAAVGSFANTVPTVLFGLLAYRIVAARLVGRRFPVQLVGHLMTGSAYAALTYWLLMVMLGAVNGTSFIQFSVEPFPTRASMWQLLQNLTVYGIVAALAYVRATAEPVALLLPDRPDAGAAQALSRYFIRNGDDIRPIDVATIISIAGADDYADVATIEGRHLVRMTLAQFEEALDPARFIRVHRSRIVNVERIARAEPAGGGRLLLHMENGELIAASRAGSRLLRDRVL